jgi:arylsulfatase A-like enzyme
MKAIMVMFDSLNRLFLPAYGCQQIDLPNFRRLQERTVVFERCYAGSMPCMPARRELQTGRYNFLHRGWGPLEPFDDSVPQMLGEAGVHTHLATDHQHYWEDGGATYHNRYSTYELVRGQEGDPWKGEVADPEIPETLSWRRGRLWRQDWINRKYMSTPDRHPQTRTFEAGLEFIETNHAQDRWFLQIECFDPHEPFYSSGPHLDRVGDDWNGPHFDWPDYRPVMEGGAPLAHLRKSYAALLTMCDDSLGRVLDTMDRHGLWDDTLLMVCTDHGFLLGERGWYGKNVQPWYEETIHVPLFLWDPRSGKAGERCDKLVQTIDLGPTLLDFFSVPASPDMDGRSLSKALAGETLHETALFGIFGGHVSITDGRYVYMRSSVNRQNRPLEEFTLMPTRIDHRYSVGELRSAELHPPFPFTKGVPVLKTPGWAMANSYDFGTLLFDLKTDPGQVEPLRDPGLELRMARLLVERMRENDAPATQFERLGLPADGQVTTDHLLCAAHWERATAARDRDWSSSPAENFSEAMRQPLSSLDPGLAERLGQGFGIPFRGGLFERFGHLSPWHLAVMLPSMTPARLHDLDRSLAAPMRVAAAPHPAPASQRKA